MDARNIIALACWTLTLSDDVVFGQDSNPVVQIEGGQLRGYTIESRIPDGVPFYAFEGVPYAAPPLVDRRFQAPLPPSAWVGIRDATSLGNQCRQWNGPEVAGDEDCLFLNVYTSQLPQYESFEPKAVIVWIHGGGFVWGNGNVGPDFFILEDVVVVSFNYRLGVFGFLTTDDEAAPGNAGLKDMIRALEWIHDNVAQFGGDPNRVTAMGESAGAAAVQYILQSPLAEGLVQRAIGHSSSSLNRWALQEDPMTRTRQLAAGYGISPNNTLELVRYLQEVGSAELWRDSDQFTQPHYRLNAEAFSPTIEPDLPGAFVTVSSYRSTSEANLYPVPYIIGTNTAEGYLYYGDMMNGQIDPNQLDSDPSLLAPVALNRPEGSEVLDDVGQIIKDVFYYGGSVTNVTSFVNHWTDESFRRGVRKTVELLKHNQPVYYYVFSFKPQGQSDHEGVTHSEELVYFWYSGQNESEETRLTRQRVTRMWANLAKYGNPTPDQQDPLLQNIAWLPASSESSEENYLDIGNDLVPGVGFQDDHYQWWEDLFSNYGAPPYIIY